MKKKKKKKESKRTLWHKIVLSELMQIPVLWYLVLASSIIILIDHWLSVNKEQID